MKNIIEVEIDEIDVDENYYTFSYKVWVDGKLREKGEINDDYENGNTPAQEIKELEKEYALELVMQRVFS